MEESLSKFMNESAKRHEKNSNMIKEIRASTDTAIRNQGASIKMLEIQIGQMSKPLQERGFGSLPSSTETNSRDHVKSISTAVETNTTPIRRIGSTRYAVSEPQNTTLLDDSLPQKEKDPGSFTLPCYTNNICFEKALADLGASVSVMPLSTYLNLGLGELAHTKLTVKLADRKVKHPKGITENVLVGIGLRERLDLDLEARLMEETLILNRSFDPLYGDYIKLNDLNEPLDLRINRNDDLEPTIEEVIENMDIYQEKEMGDVIIKEPFCMVSYVEARRFDGLITIHNGDNNVTYQMVRSHPRFKHLSNEKCNKIPPLLKVSAQDEQNEISHSYQKLKTFYKGILDLGTEYIRDEKIVERLTREHISVYEME
ncbi:ribonuclease H-like domain-containing protein [Tanacetum coccineum]